MSTVDFGNPDVIVIGAGNARIEFAHLPLDTAWSFRVGKMGRQYDSGNTRQRFCFLDHFTCLLHGEPKAIHASIELEEYLQLIFCRQGL